MQRHFAKLVTVSQCIFKKKKIKKKMKTKVFIYTRMVMRYKVIKGYHKSSLSGATF